MDEHLSQRELRRKRRKKNQMLANITLVLLVLAIGGAVFLGGKAIGKVFADSKSPKEEIVVDLIPTKAPTPEPTIAPIEEPDLLGELADGIISNMTIEEKVAGLFIITPEALTGYNQVVKAGPSTKEALEKYPVGGLIYFSKNLQDEAQIKEMLSNTISYSKFIPFLAVDEEGGNVSRVANTKNMDVPIYEDMNVFASKAAPEDAYGMGMDIGTYLSDLGFNLDFAPVADVVEGEDSPLFKRSFGSDPATVSAFSSAVVRGLQDTKISACMKHFPGLGSLTEDTHNVLPVINQTAEELNNKEFIPFAAGITAGVDFIMVGHVALPEIVGDNTPASLSKMVLTDLLRKQLGFKGVVITDSLQMVSITKDYSSAEAAVAAIEAGADMLLMPKNFEEAYHGILEAVQNGTITEARLDESLHRIFVTKYKYTELANK